MACSSTSTAISGTQPNLRDNGHSAPAPSHRMRQNTCTSEAATRPRPARSSRPRPRNRPRRDARRARGAGDVALLLDRVAERDPIGRRAGSKRKLDLDDRSRVEARAEIGQQLEDCRIRVCLHGVEDARVGKSPGEFGVVVAHHVEVDDDARSVLTSVAQEFANTLCHRRSPTKAQWRLSRLRIEVQTFEPAKA